MTTNASENSEYRNLLRLAIKANDVSRSKFLLDLGVNADAGLWTAIDEGNSNMVRMLLDYGADVKLLDHYERNPLLYALFCEQLHLVPLLLKRGISANQEDYKGRTALMLLSQPKDSQERGRGEHRTGESAYKPKKTFLSRLRRCLRRGTNWLWKTYLTRLLHRVGGGCYDEDPSQRLIGATNRLFSSLDARDHEKATEAIRMGADVSASREGKTVLELAAEVGHLELFRRILAEGVDPAQGCGKWLPRHS